MSRSDLLISLVRASVIGDKDSLRKTVESMIAEERSKQHNVLADRLAKALHANPVPNGNGSAAKPVQMDPGLRAVDLIHEVVPRRSLRDLVLTSACRTGVEQLIEEQIRCDVLRAHSLQPRHKMLLVGPPGNGKTSLAEAIAEALSVPLLVVRYESVIGSFLGETSVRLKRVFDLARTMPCVLFFDEFDALGKERGDIHETGEIKRVVTSLLLQIDDLPSYTVVIAATNHEELLDRAAWRRFELRVELPPPNQLQLQEFFAKFLVDDVVVPVTKLKELARLMKGASYSDAEQLCLNVKRKIVLNMNTDDPVNLLKSALDEWTMGSKRPEQIKRGNSGKALPSDTVRRSS